MGRRTAHAHARLRGPGAGGDRVHVRHLRRAGAAGHRARSIAHRRAGGQRRGLPRCRHPPVPAARTGDPRAGHRRWIVGGGVGWPGRGRRPLCGGDHGDAADVGDPGIAQAAGTALPALSRTQRPAAPAHRGGYAAGTGGECRPRRGPAGPVHHPASARAGQRHRRHRLRPAAAARADAGQGGAAGPRRRRGVGGAARAGRGLGTRTRRWFPVRGGEGRTASIWTASSTASGARSPAPLRDRAACRLQRAPMPCIFGEIPSSHNHHKLIWCPVARACPRRASCRPEGLDTCPGKGQSGE